MATIINFSGGAYGIAADETALNIEAFEVKCSPSFRELLGDRVNNPKAWAIGASMQNITLSGEISGSTGPMAFTFTTACTLANMTSLGTIFGISAGDVLLEEATVSQARAGWKSLSQSLRRDVGVTV